MKIYKAKFLIVLTGLLTFSCMNFDCVKLSESYKAVECLIIVSDLPNNKSGYNFKIKGISLKTGKDTVYDEENRWLCKYYKEIEKGDTIIKKNGELIFNIHKKDTILRFNWECEGKIYN